MGALNTGADAIVIGGGPGGSAAAIRLARAGADVVVLERDRAATAKVCGEFLSVEAGEEARELGVDVAGLGAAPIDRVRVTWGSASVESALPFRASSLSRARLDEALLASARAAGVRVERGARAVSLDSGAVHARRDGHDVRLEARAIVLASGKSDISALRRRGGHFPDALGFKMHLELGARQYDELGTAVELTLFAGGYAGMQRIEDGLVAFAAVIGREAYGRYGSWRVFERELASSSPRLAARLEGSRELWPKPLAVSGTPYGFVYRDRVDGPETGPYRVGDQLAVIPSFTGDGMAIALVTGSSAAAAIAGGRSAPAFHAAMRRRLRAPMTVAAVLSRAIGTAAGRAALVWPARAVPQLFAIVAERTRISRPA